MTRTKDEGAVKQDVNSRAPMRVAISSSPLGSVSAKPMAAKSSTLTQRPLKVVQKKPITISSAVVKKSKSPAKKVGLGHLSKDTPGKENSNSLTSIFLSFNLFLISLFYLTLLFLFNYNYNFLLEANII